MVRNLAPLLCTLYKHRHIVRGGVDNGDDDVHAVYDIYVHVHVQIHVHAGSNCAGGGLLIYDDQSNDVTDLATLCGHRAPMTIFSTHNSMRLELYGFDASDELAISLRYDAISKAVENAHSFFCAI